MLFEIEAHMWTENNFGFADGVEDADLLEIEFCMEEWVSVNCWCYKLKKTNRMQLIPSLVSECEEEVNWGVDGNVGEGSQ